MGQGSVAAVGDGPFGAADGGGAVLPLVRTCPWRWRAAAGGSCSRARRCRVAVLGLAGGVAGGALERALDEGERGQSPARAWVSLKTRAAERPGLGLGLLLLGPLAADVAGLHCGEGGGQGQRAVQGVDHRVVGDLLSSVRGMKTPWILISTTPLTSEMLNVLPSAGAPGPGRGGLERHVRAERRAGAVGRDQPDVVGRVGNQAGDRRRHRVAGEIRAHGLRRRRLV